jgi:putative drug exporter of the RND superfamily
MIRVTAWSVRRPWRALAVWALVTVSLAALGSQLPGHLASTSIEVPGSSSARAGEVDRRAFGARSEVPVLLTGPPSQVAKQRLALTAALDALPAVRASAVPGRHLPRSGDGARQSQLVIARVPSVQSFDGEAAERVRRVVDRTVTPPVVASVTGFSAIGGAVSEESVAAAHDAELIAIPILLIVLLLVFRSPVAAGIPALLGLATVASAYGLVDLVARSRDITDVATPLTSMLGLALGVDYALLMVSRFREFLADGLSVTDAALSSGQSSGRTVVFAGATLLLTMITAMLLSPGSFLLSAAVGVSAAGIMGMFGALLAVPAMLVLLGTNIDRLRIGGPSRSGGGWARYADAVQRRPIPATAAALVVLLALAPAALGLDTGPPDVRTLPSDTRARLDTEATARAIGPGWIAPARILAAPGPQGRPPSPAAVDQLRQELRSDPAVQAVLGPERGRDGVLALTVIPKRAANDPETDALLRTLRARAREAPAEAGQVSVGGVAAQLGDYRRVLSARLPVLIAALSVVALLALIVVLRALVVPLISIVLNLITVTASLGVLALLSTGEDPLLGGAGFADILALFGMFAIVFALSLDYQVFILARMRESFDHTGRLDLAITQSIDATGRVITGAAAIMGGVFLAFMATKLQTVRQPGAGLVTAVLIDATLVRLVLLPATMRLAGRWCFWLPAWLDRRLPRLALEGPPQPTICTPPAPATARQL